MDSPRPLCIGALGAARITPEALVQAAKLCPEVRVTAVAARSTERARSFAREHGIGRAHDSYEALLADPEVDAVYIALPNGLHGRWTLAALAAKKHVLCEKPFAANAEEARHVADAAAASGLVVMEAFHYRHHPLARRMEEIVKSGELGEILRIETALCFPLPFFRDIRYRLDLAGGALMDGGCYAVNLARLLGGGRPAVVSANAKLRSPGVDRAMRAELRFPGGASGHVLTSMWSTDLLRASARVVGSAGEMKVFNPYMPQRFHRLTVHVGRDVRRERSASRPTYAYQLDAFAAACLRGAPVLTSAEDAVVNMSVIDDVYRAAGLKVREPCVSRQGAGAL